MEDNDLAFGIKEAEHYDKWFSTHEGQYTDRVEKDLLIKLMKPKAGETLLEVGCGTGNYLLFFNELGYQVTGLDPSPHMMKYVEGKVPDSISVFQGVSENLPFPDNSFDVVALITSFEFVKEAQKGVEEALRVARKQVVFGILNKISCKNMMRRMQAKKKKSVFLKIKFYSACEMKKLIHAAAESLSIKGIRINWGTVLTLPHCWKQPIRFFENMLPSLKNPFGAFLALNIELSKNKGE